MGSVARTRWLSQLLRQLPAPLIAALDAWSYRLAMRKAERRRRAR